MKQLLKIGILTFGISLFTISCSNENVAEIEQTETQQLQNKFTLDNFDDVFVKNYLEIDWDDFKTNPNSESELISYEFNAHFKVKSTIEDYAKYKLLASKDELNDWNFEIVKFSTSKENTNNDLSYFSIDNFTGSIYHYNLDGNNTLIKVYSKGKITEEISAKDLGNVNPLAKAPADGGTHCTGCWTLVRTDHFTDWYTNSGGGTTLYYSHSTYDGASTEWVYIPSNGDYYGMPYDPEDGAYHNHYDYPHGGGSTDNHNDEDVIEEDVLTGETPPSCRAFEYSNVTSNWQASATKNIVALIGYYDVATGDYNIAPVLFPQPIYFEMPINSASNGGYISSGRAAELTALAVKTAINRAKYYFLSTNASSSQVQAKLWEYIRDEMTNGTHIVGGKASFTPPLGFNGQIKDYESYWFLPDDCD